MDRLRMARRMGAGLAAAFLLAFGADALAQSGELRTGDIGGTVLDDAGNAVEGVEVTIVGEDGAVVDVAVSGESGAFGVNVPEQGSYEVLLDGKPAYSFVANPNATATAFELLLPKGYVAGSGFSGWWVALSASEKASTVVLIAAGGVGVNAVVADDDDDSASD